MDSRKYNLRVNTALAKDDMSSSSAMDVDYLQERKGESASEDSSFKSSDLSEYTSEAPRNGKKRTSRKIKDLKQLKCLEEFFNLDPEWSKTTTEFISGFMNLTKLQLYKWGYDQKRKCNYKKGIRNKLRENRRRKFSYNSATDYNTMVSELFPEEEDTAVAQPIDLTYKFEELKAKFLHQKSLTSGTDHHINDNHQVGRQYINTCLPRIEGNPFECNFGNMDVEDEYHHLLDFETPFRDCNSSGLEAYKFPRLS